MATYDQEGNPIPLMGGTDSMLNMAPGSGGYPTNVEHDNGTWNNLLDRVGLGPVSTAQYNDRGLVNPKAMAFGHGLQRIAAINQGKNPGASTSSVMQRAMAQNQALMQERARQYERRQEQKQAMAMERERLRIAQRNSQLASTAPKFFKSGNNVVAVHPLTGQSRVAYRGPEDWEVHGSADEGFWRISPTTGNREQITGPVSPSGYFKGTSMAAQEFNALLGRVSPEDREAVAVELISQKFGRPMQTTTADGTTYTQPGINVDEILSRYTQDGTEDLMGQGIASRLGGGALNIPEVTQKEPTQAERQALGFYDRMLDAEKRIQEVFKRYPDFNPAGDLVEYTGGKLSDFLGTDTLKSEAWQLFDSALNDWVGAKLRKESGAAIGDQEKAQEIQRYFPRFGSSNAKQVDLERARLKALQSLQKEAGKAFEPSDTGWYWSDKLGLVTLDDIQQTAEEENLTPEQVIEQLNLSKWGGE